jgi:hypothetical protein
MPRRSTALIASVCAYVVFAFACEEPRHVVAEFDYSIAQLREPRVVAHPRGPATGLTSSRQ